MVSLFIIIDFNNKFLFHEYYVYLLKQYNAFSGLGLICPDWCEPCLGSECLPKSSMFIKGMNKITVTSDPRDQCTSKTAL